MFPSGPKPIFGLAIGAYSFFWRGMGLGVLVYAFLVTGGAPAAPERSYEMRERFPHQPKLSHRTFDPNIQAHQTKPTPKSCEIHPVLRCPPSPKMFAIIPWRIPINNFILRESEAINLCAMTFDWPNTIIISTSTQATCQHHTL